MASINEKNLALGDKSKFQLVLVGYDQDKAGQEKYLKASKLGSVAVKFESKEEIAELLKNGFSGFYPNIVQLKADGTVVSNDDDTVLKAMEALVK